MGKNGKKNSAPEKNGIGRNEYERELRKLQVELCRLQAWVKQEGKRLILIFEGRDGAGKGGTIKAITERVSPRVFRVARAACSVGPRKESDVHPALHAALSSGR